MLPAQRFNFPQVAFAVDWPGRNVNCKHLLRFKRQAEGYVNRQAIHHASVLQSVLAAADVASPRGKHTWERCGAPYRILQAKLRCLAVADDLFSAQCVVSHNAD